MNWAKVVEPAFPFDRLNRQAVEGVVRDNIPRFAASDLGADYIDVSDRHTPGEAPAAELDDPTGETRSLHDSEPRKGVVPIEAGKFEPPGKIAVEVVFGGLIWGFADGYRGIFTRKLGASGGSRLRSLFGSWREIYNVAFQRILL